MTRPAWTPFELCQGVRAVFTGRSGGVSTGPFATLNLGGSVGDQPAAVASNRQRVLAGIGLGPVRLVWMRQVHGAGVFRVPDLEAAAPPVPEPDGAVPQADACFTGSAAVAIGTLAADCAPVLVADPVARLVGAAHAGRPGMAAGVVPALVTAMTQAGAQPGRMHAMIGPSICGQCYEVPPAMRDEVAAAVPGSACRTREGTAGIDLRAGLRGQLAVLRVGQISDDMRCTAECSELFSYRRDGQTGRFAGLIWLAP